ncbi:methyltransferase domain-containing protein [Mucilaginibacter sp. UYCu711]|uniref:class I SAM-dependent methyltransferase n=1 Tax=Mucilaginibacter sp. UYCu711 TaxID=3156339 RepID=UPI003D2523B0
MNNEKQNVYKVYDKIANWFAANRNVVLLEKKYLDDLSGRLPEQASVLDLGCGTGVPILKYLVDQNVNVTGVDASSEILAIAKINFPATEFILQDMRQLKLSRKFDAIIAWNSFFHLPAEDQPAMFSLFAQHLKPSGILLFTSGTAHGEAWGINGGENLFHGSLDTAEYEDLLKTHNFEVIKHVIDDEECGATVWMARYIG